MTSGRHMVDVLPRLAPRRGRAVPAWNAAGLLGAALVGAALVHLLAYHLPPGLPLEAGWGARALALLGACPLLGPLGAIIAIAILAPLLAFCELRRLRRLSVTLAQRLAGRNAPPALAAKARPRSYRRLAGFAAMVLGLQVVLVNVAGLVCPMQLTMVMGGRPMTMPLAPAAPLWLLHLLVAGLLALLLWRVERRLAGLRARIALQLRLLSPAQRTCDVQPPICDAVRLPLGWCGGALFARPPPRPA